MADPTTTTPTATPQPAVPSWVVRTINATDLSSDPEVIGVITALVNPELSIPSDAERLAGIRAVLHARAAASDEAARAYPGDLAAVVSGPSIGRLVRVVRDNGADLECEFEDDPSEGVFGLDYDQVRKVEVPR